MKTPVFVSRSRFLRGVGIGAALGGLWSCIPAPLLDDGLRPDPVVPLPVAALQASRLTWGPGEGPDAREHGAMFVGHDGATIHVYGGSGYPQDPDNVLDDGWQLDVASNTWTPWTITGDRPPPGAFRGVQIDDDTAVLVGGYLADFAADGSAFAVTLSTGAFRRLEQVPAPPARSLHLLAWDDAGDRIVMFGGFGPDGPRNDAFIGTVELEPGRIIWTAVSSELRPSPRYGAFGGVDIRSGHLVLFSGAQAPRGADQINAAQDIWTLALHDASWQQRTFSGAPPNGRRNGCGVFDPVTRALIVYGGTADGRTSEPGGVALVVEDAAGGDVGFRFEPVDVGDVPVRSSGFGVALPGGGVACGFGNDSEAFRDIIRWQGP